MKETIVSFNAANIITIGVIVFVVSAIFAVLVRVWASIRSNSDA